MASGRLSGAISARAPTIAQEPLIPRRRPRAVRASGHPCTCARRPILTCPGPADERPIANVQLSGGGARPSIDSQAADFTRYWRRSGSKITTRFCHSVSPRFVGLAIDKYLLSTMSRQIRRSLPAKEGACSFRAAGAPAAAEPGRGGERLSTASRLLSVFFPARAAPC